MTTEEILAHPEYPHIVWALKPTRSGIHPCGATRGGPYNIAWQLHGHGPRHLILIMGLGGIMSSWQRQTRDFAERHPDMYSVLLLDNRGMGRSDKPLLRATTSGMAADVLEICALLGWTAPRSLHVVGISLGGMIAQEVAAAAPTRLATLTLVSTAARLVNTIGFLENLQQRAQLFLPKSLDAQIAGALERQFTRAHVDGPDRTEAVVRAFPTGGDRYAAAEVAKKTTPGVFTRRGFMNQAWAAAWHRKSAAQLEELAGRVGRRRIMVVHGTQDRMITFPHGETLVRELNAGGADEADVVREEFFEGQGHVIPIELRQEFGQLLTEQMELSETLPQ